MLDLRFISTRRAHLQQRPRAPRADGGFVIDRDNKSRAAVENVEHHETRAGTPRCRPHIRSIWRDTGENNDHTVAPNVLGWDGIAHGHYCGSFFQELVR